MKWTFVVLLAAAAAALATPAAAGGYFASLDAAAADDAYPPGETSLSFPVQEAVRARQDFGLSLAGFYNDPGLALSRRFAPADYDAPAYGEAAEPGFQYDRHPGPRVIVSPYGRHHRHAHNDGTD